MPRSTTVMAPAKAIFAGIDFHKRFSVVTLGDSNGNFLELHELINDEHIIRKFFLRHGPLKCAIENCRGNEWFIDLVKECGCQIYVSNNHAVRLITDSNKKNDKIDSKILMELLAKGYLPVCYQPTQEERLLREHLRWRTKLMRSRTQYKNVTHAFMDKENKGAQLHSSKQRTKLHEKLSIGRKARVQRSLKVIDFFEERLGVEDQELLKLAKKNPDVERLKTMPGVGVLSALMLFAELGDVTRFQNAKNVGGYLGLVPRHASSDTRRLGSITKQGPRYLRRILVQDAWQAIKVSPSLRKRYSSILKRRGKKVAVVAIARKLAEIAYHILRDKTEFDEKKLTLG